MVVKNACSASSMGSTGAPEWSGVLTERTWLQLMCCALSDGGPSISELSGVESRRSLGGVGSWIKGSEDQRQMWVGVGVGVGVGGGGVAKMSKLSKSVEDRTRVLDLIFELKIIHARE
jgi:hypothetical protein